MIIDMKLPGVTLEQEADAAAKLKIMREDIGPLTAERIYRYMKHNPLTAGEKQDLQRLFFRDVHSLWKPAEQLEITQEQWKKSASV